MLSYRHSWLKRLVWNSETVFFMREASISRLSRAPGIQILKALGCSQRLKNVKLSCNLVFWRLVWRETSHCWRGKMASKRATVIFFYVLGCCYSWLKMLVWLLEAQGTDTSFQRSCVAPLRAFGDHFMHRNAKSCVLPSQSIHFSDASSLCCERF